MARLKALRPTDKAALALGLLGVLAVVAYYSTPYLHAWLPNGATELWSIAITVAVVERIVRREAESRIEPRVKAAMDDVAEAVHWLVRAVASDYVETHISNYEEPPTDHQAVVDLWLARKDDADATRSSGVSGLPEIMDHAAIAVGMLERIRSDDREALEPALVVAVRDLERNLRMARTLYEFGRALRQSQKHEPERQAETARQIVEAIRDFLPVYRAQRGASRELREVELSAMKGVHLLAVQRARERDESNA